MNDTEDELFYQAVSATAELSGSKLSATAVQMLTQDLLHFPRQQVMAALRRCRREGVKRLTVKDVIGRIDDGRPAPDEAWGMLPKDERGSVVWCQEMAQALELAQQLINEADWMAARVVFKEGYARFVEVSRAAGIAPMWTLNQGHDDDALERALLTAITHGRTSSAVAKEILPRLGMKSIPIYPLSTADPSVKPEQEDDDE